MPSYPTGHTEGTHDSGVSKLDSIGFVVTINELDTFCLSPIYCMYGCQCLSSCICRLLSYLCLTMDGSEDNGIILSEEHNWQGNRIKLHFVCITVLVELSQRTTLIHENYAIQISISLVIGSGTTPLKALYYRVCKSFYGQYGNPDFRVISNRFACAHACQYTNLSQCINHNENGENKWG